MITNVNWQSLIVSYLSVTWKCEAWLSFFREIVNQWIDLNSRSWKYFFVISRTIPNCILRLKRMAHQNVTSDSDDAIIYYDLMRRKNEFKQWIEILLFLLLNSMSLAVTPTAAGSLMTYECLVYTFILWILLFLEYLLI